MNDVSIVGSVLDERNIIFLWLNEEEIIKFLIALIILNIIEKDRHFALYTVRYFSKNVRKWPDFWCESNAVFR